MRVFVNFWCEIGAYSLLSRLVVWCCLVRRALILCVFILIFVKVDNIGTKTAKPLTLKRGVTQ